MGKAEKEKLNLALSEHFNNIHETFQVLDQGPAPSVDKVSWSEVIKMGEQVSKQATVGLSLSLCVCVCFCFNFYLYVLLFISYTIGFPGWS
ncbi:hypothetical protein NMG60_11018884 [Bertholletia excelsa]